MIVVTFDLYLWLENTQIYPILYINNQMACIDSFTTAYTIENIITIIALLLQLSLRLYLRFVKKIKSSNEILSIKFILFLLFSTLSYFLPPPESSRTVFFELGIPFAIFLTTVLFDHSGINQFFMDKHPKIHDATTVIWHLMVQFYVKAKEFIYYMWNFIEEIFLHLFRSNQIHPYHVNQ